MTGYALVPATTAHAASLTPRLRACEATLGIERSINGSFFSRAWLVDGVVACIGGLGQVQGVVVPWILPSDLIHAHRTAFARGSRQMLKELLQEYPRLDGVIDLSHPYVLRWMTFLGATVSDHIEHAPALNMSFRRFYIERSTNG